MNKRVAIYARVSTDDQAERGYSLPSQIEACRMYADQLGYIVIAEFREDISGATPITERPQGHLLVEMIRRREVDAVVIYQVDRLSRDIVDLLSTIRNWLGAGVEVYALDVGKIESELDIVLVIKGWQGSDERKKIRERSMRGKRTKAKSGRVIGTRAPYGYRHIRDDKGRIETFQPIDEQARIVQLIFQWYVFGDENGSPLPAGEIARRLSEMHIPTPGEVNNGFHRKRPTCMWGVCGVLDIISREAYAGSWHFGVRIGSTRNKRPPEDWVTVNVPPIVDHGMWEAAQNRRKRNKELSRRNAKYDYLLSGYMKCDCGCAMTGEFFSHHIYYSCSWRNNHHSKLEDRLCWQRSIRADAIEADIWDCILDVFSDAAHLEELLIIAQRRELAALDPKQEEFSVIEAMINEAEQDAIAIGQALKRANGIVANSLEKDMLELNRRYEALCKRRDILQSELSSIHLTHESIQELVEFTKVVFIGIENADFETKRRILELLQVRVTIKDRYFYVSSIAGCWEGNIRKIKRQGKVGVENDLRLPIPFLH